MPISLRRHGLDLNVGNVVVMVDGQGADDAGNVAPVDVFQFQGVEGPPEVD
ncbi:hypothetical protein [Limosilactobacillus sp.]|uniref:hypothetical protein n=1 Tax=Limosilactobacillus sp. TaxID=2773925 RepID=UPI0035A13366